MADITNIAALKPDARNARQHGPRNLGMIVDSLHHVGAARSIVIDEHGTILAGNGVVEAAAEAGIERVQVVDADGETIIAVRRTGLSDEDKRRLAYYDNRTAEVAEWDVEQIAADLADGFDFHGMFTDEELDKMLAVSGRGDRTLEEIDANELPVNPVWCLCTISIDKLPRVQALLEQLRAEGATVEISL